MRAFLALPIPEPTLSALIALQGPIPVGRPVPEENLHLTLAFLGAVAEGDLADLDAALRQTRLLAPQIRFGGLGTFAEMERGLVFAEVLASDELTRVHDKLARIVRSGGIELQRRRFRPHVTLMRANRQPKGPARDRLALALGEPVDVPGFKAEALVLYESVIGPSGARHVPLAEYGLG